MTTAHPTYDLAPGIQIIQGDCLEVLPTLEADSVDSVICDPPYGLNFMNKDWDHGIPGEHFWREVLHVAKPGAHLLAFGGTRTFHRLICAIEDAGWQIRDCIMWVYGSGFPKSLDVSKAIDKMAKADRKVLISIPDRWAGKGNILQRSRQAETESVDITIRATEAARQWAGWGTALKPAWEPIIVARKPLDGTVTENVLRWGTGAINIDGCRVATDEINPSIARRQAAKKSGKAGLDMHSSYRGKIGLAPYNKDLDRYINGHDGEQNGRFPANLIHDGSDEVVGLFPMTTSPTGSTIRAYGAYKTVNGASNYRPCHDSNQTRETINGFGDTGSAARFFYTAKASKADRDEGCEMLDAAQTIYAAGSGLCNNGDGTPRNQTQSSKNIHPTVKPTDLMRYLCRLVTRPKGIILDPFMGSGSTGKAAILEDCYFIGIEIDPDYCEIARCRLEQELAQGRLDLTG